MSRRLPPLEVLYHVCALVAAEFLDTIIAGSLRYSPPTIADDGLVSVSYTDTALTAHNPIVQILQTSHVLRNAMLMVVSDALGILIDETGVRKLTAKPWARIQPVRVLRWKARSRSLRWIDVSWETPCCKSESPLLRSYERLAFLFDQTRSTLGYSTATSVRLEYHSLVQPQATSESTPTTDISKWPINASRKHFLTWLDAIPPSQEGLSLYIYRRLVGVMFLYQYADCLFAASWLTDPVTRSFVSKLPYSMLHPGYDESRKSDLLKILETIDLLEERAKLGNQKDGLPLYENDDWDLEELLDVANLKPSEPIPSGDLEMRLLWALRHLKVNLEAYNDILANMKERPSTDYQTAMASLIQAFNGYANS